MCFLSWAVDWRDSNYLYQVGLALLSIVVLTAFLLDGRRGMYVLLCVLLCGQDILQSQTEALIYGEASAPSIWRLRLGPVNPSWLVLSLLLCFYVAKLRPRGLTRLEMILIVYFAFTGIVSFAYGNQAEGIGRWASDLKFPAFLVLGLIMFRSYLEAYPTGLLPVALCAGLCWLSRHLVDFCYLVIGIVTTSIGGVNRVSVDSAKPMVVLLLLWGIALVAVHRRFIIGSLVASVAASLVVVYMTRTLWLGAGISLLLFVVLGIRYGLVSTRLPFASCAALALALWLVFSLSPDYIRIATQRAGDVISDPVSSDYVRLASSVNLLGKIRDDGAFLWGLGYGGWYTDEYMPLTSEMRRVDIDAFDPEWVSLGKFYRIHNVLLQFVFKHGVLGLVLFLYLWLAPIPALHRLALRIKSASTNLADQEMHLGVVSWLCLGFLPTAITNLAWSAKGVLISAFIMVVMHRLAAETNSQHRHSAPR